MKLSGLYSITKCYLLPCVLLAAVFFVSQGITVLTLCDPQEAKLSNPQNAKPQVSLVAKSKLNALKSRVVNAAQFLDCCRLGDGFWNPAALGAVVHHETRSVIYVAVSAIPARAPPT